MRPKMIYIVVDDEQAKLINETGQGVEIRDKRGRHLGFVAHGFSDADIKLAKSRVGPSEPRLTTKEVLDYLSSLEVK
jgi:hypothetical protein